MEYITGREPKGRKREVRFSDVSLFIFTHARTYARRCASVPREGEGAKGRKSIYPFLGYGAPIQEEETKKREKKKEE